MNNIINKIAFWFGVICYGALMIIGFTEMKAYETKYTSVAKLHDEPLKQAKLIIHKIRKETEES